MEKNVGGKIVLINTLLDYESLTRERMTESLSVAVIRLNKAAAAQSYQWFKAVLHTCRNLT